MVYSLIGSALLFLLLAVPFPGISSIRYDCHYDSDKLQFEERDGCDFIRIKDFGIIEEKGKPILPVDFINLLIPQNQKAESLRVTIKSPSIIEGKHRIKIFHTDEEFPLTDSTLYISDTPYPGKRAEIVSTGSFGGNRIANIKVYPIDYSPKTGRLVLFSDLEIELFHGPSRKISAKQLYRTTHSERIIQK